MNFIAIPAQKNSSEVYYAARPGIDFSPMNGQFIFEPGSNISQINFSIYSSDDLSMSKMFKVALLSVEDCEYCEIGTNREANVFMKFIKTSLITWNSGPSLSLDSTTNRICGINRDRYPVRVNAELLVVDLEKLSEQVINNVIYETILSDNSSQIVFNPGKTECIYVIPSSWYKNCYNITFQLRLNSSYVINNNLLLYSSLQSVDIFNFQSINTNCCSVSFDSRFISNTLEMPINFSNSSLSRQSIRVPIELKSCSELGLISISYNVEYDSIADEFFDFIDIEESFQPRNLVNGKYLATKQLYFSINTKEKNASWFIEFDLVRMNVYPYYFLPVKLTLIQSELGDFKVNKSESSTYIKFITKDNQLSDYSLCNIISLSAKLTQFSYLSFRTRILTIGFESSLINKNLTCLTNVLFSIVKLNSANIRDYIIDDLENLFHTFLSNSTVLEFYKQINVNNRVYIDMNDMFLINLTSVVSLDSKMICYLNSPGDSYLIVNPSSDVANGAATLSPNMEFIPDKWNPYNLDNYYKLYLDLELSRLGSYWIAQTLFSLELIDHSNFPTEETENRNNVFQITDVYLKSSETNRRFQVGFIINDFSNYLTKLLNVYF